MARASSRAAMAASRSRASASWSSAARAGGGEPLVGLLELSGEAAHGGLLAGELSAQRRDLLGGDALAGRGAGGRRCEARCAAPRPARARLAGPRRAWQRPLGGRLLPAALAGDGRDGQVDREAGSDGKLGRRELDRLALPREGGDPFVAVLGGPRLVVEDRQHAPLLVGRLHHEHGPDEAMAAQAVPAPGHLEAVARRPTRSDRPRSVTPLETTSGVDMPRPAIAARGYPIRPARSTQPTRTGRNASRRRAR